MKKRSREHLNLYLDDVIDRLERQKAGLLNRIKQLKKLKTEQVKQ